MRKWIIATAVLLTVPMVGAAAVIVAPPVQEQLVEGHTVFSVIQVRNSSEADREEFAAAVAVLVREYTSYSNYGYTRFPGVLWFNDQYLVNPLTAQTVSSPAPERFPCGAVIAVNSGDPVPLAANGMPVVPAGATYVESYHITDPNDNAWDVDKWSLDPDADPLTANSYLMWSVSVRNNQANYGVPDDGTKNLCGPYNDSPGCGTPILPFVDDTPQRPPGYGGQMPFEQDPTYNETQDSITGGPGGEGRFDDAFGNPMCSSADLFNTGPGYTTPNAAKGYSYNAVLYFFLQDLTSFGGIKDHTASTDAPGCHPTTSPAKAWPCPGGDDNAEGNSHQYNLERPWPFQVSEGRNNHGGSSGCGAGDIGAGAQYQHATCNIDVYFGYKEAPLPAVRNYRVYDAEGRTAPYHCHEDKTQYQAGGQTAPPESGLKHYCNEEEFNSAL